MFFTLSAVRKQVESLNWTHSNLNEEDIMILAADILSKLVGFVLTGEMAVCREGGLNATTAGKKEL